jgi:hypothetical protein
MSREFDIISIMIVTRHSPDELLRDGKKYVTSVNEMTKVPLD